LLHYVCSIISLNLKENFLTKNAAIMTRLLVLSFADEPKAVDAMRKLNELELQGDITVYEKTMVRKKADGDYEILKEENREGWKTITGMAIGGLIGMLGGPIGLVVGLYAGTTIGAYSVMNHYDKAEGFLRKVESHMPPDTVSIIAEVEDSSSYQIDTIMLKMGAVITWTDTDLDHVKYFGEQIGEINHQIVAAREALKTATPDDKLTIEKKLAVLHDLRKVKVAAIKVESENTLQITGDENVV